MPDAPDADDAPALDLSWSRVLGQDRPKDILERAIETGRVHHAYLLAGLQGVGKYRTALSFSAVVNCLARPEETFRDACGTCSSCRKIAEGYHPDVFTVAPEGGSSVVKIDQIREIEEDAAKQPHEARYRMVMLDEAHAMTTEAANALLKTLEEPATRMRLLLVTHQSHQLLETIISRCQQIRFGGLEYDDVLTILRREIDRRDDFEERPDESTLELAAGYGQGSAGRSLEILASGLLDERREMIERVVERPAGRPKGLLELAESMNDRDQDLSDCLDVLKLYFRDLMLYKTRTSEEGRVNRDLDDLLERHADVYTTDELPEIIESIVEAQHELDRNIHGQLVMENLLPELHPREG